MEPNISAHFVALLRDTRLLLLSESHESVATQLEQKSLSLSLIHDQLVGITVLMANLQVECQNKAMEIREEIDMRAKLADGSAEPNSGGHFPFVFHGKYKTMSWGDISTMEEQSEELLLQTEKLETDLASAEGQLEAADRPHPEDMPKPARAAKLEAPPVYKKIDTLDGVELPREIKIKMVAKLEDLSPAFAWYNGDKTHRQGIYLRLPDNFFVRVPFPDVIDSTQNFARTKTIKCKYSSEEQCSENRKFLANKYSTNMRECLFAHKGDTYTKVGTNFRCPVNPRFGNHQHLKADIRSIKADDVKPVLMYALSDLLTCFIWNSYHHSADKIIFSDVEIC